MNERTYEAVRVHIRDNPDEHKHDNLNQLNACCTIDGMVDTRLLDAHQGIGRDEQEGRRCDVSKGACACGAWH